MVLDAIRKFVSRRPAWVMTIWLGVAAAIGCFSPNLTRLAAEAQASMLPADAESLRSRSGQSILARPSLRCNGRGGLAQA